MFEFTKVPVLSDVSPVVPHHLEHHMISHSEWISISVNFENSCNTTGSFCTDNQLYRQPGSRTVDFRSHISVLLRHRNPSGPLYDISGYGPGPLLSTPTNSSVYKHTIDTRPWSPYVWSMDSYPIEWGRRLMVNLVDTLRDLATSIRRPSLWNLGLEDY